MEYNISDDDAKKDIDDTIKKLDEVRKDIKAGKFSPEKMKEINKTSLKCLAMADQIIAELRDFNKKLDDELDKGKK